MSKKVSSILLQRLHRILSQQSDLQGQLERIPLAIKASQGKVDEKQTLVDAESERLRETRRASNEKQLLLKEREAKVESLQAKLNTAASNKEYTLLEEQIAADKSANDVLSDEVFEFLERLDAQESELNSLQEARDSQQKEHEGNVERIEARRKDVLEKLTLVQAEHGEARRELPASISLEYDHRSDAMQEDALAAIEENSCGNCRQTITTQALDQLSLSHLVICHGCGAILYLPQT